MPGAPKHTLSSAATATEAEAATAADDQNTIAAVLPFVLRNARLPLQTLCRLLQTSQATANAVHNSCTGTHQLRVVTLKPSMVQWLARNASLLRVLLDDRGLARSPSPTASDSKALAAALTKAAARPSSSSGGSSGLLLQHLTTSSLAVLKAASSSSSRLTSLHLRPTEADLFPSPSEVAECITGRDEGVVGGSGGGGDVTAAGENARLWRCI